MKAVVRRGPEAIGVEDVPEPTIKDPYDAIAHITTSAICGTDLPFDGREAGWSKVVLGVSDDGAIAPGLGKAAVARIVVYHEEPRSDTKGRKGTQVKSCVHDCRQE
ncbi:hypothetical protein ABZ618_15585 [Streptomyces roseolus]|uniref:hypothetical protein n=1 Tax=Streptomyces roseolus TaxID=67358 RepID=UPI0033C60CF0